MAQNIFKVRRAFLIPLTAVIVLLFLLLFISLFRGQMWERIILAVFFISSLLIGIETARREIVVTEEGLQLKKFFRIKNFFWREITHLGVVELRNKAYFLLTTTKGFYFFSNILGNHALLIRFLVDKLGAGKSGNRSKKLFRSSCRTTFFDCYELDCGIGYYCSL